MPEVAPFREEKGDAVFARKLDDELVRLGARGLDDGKDPGTA